MVYNIQNQWVYGLWPPSTILTFRELYLFPSLGEGETPILLGLVERANICQVIGSLTGPMTEASSF
jgi:hypothetical protein